MKTSCARCSVMGCHKGITSSLDAKVNTVGLDMRNWMKLPEYRQGSVMPSFMNLGYSVRI